MIKFQNIRKTCRVAKRQAGFINAVKSLFSREFETIHVLGDMNFRIADGDVIGYIGSNTMPRSWAGFCAYSSFYSKSAQKQCALRPSPSISLYRPPHANAHTQHQI